MKRQKLLPKIKIISFNEDDIMTPICPCVAKPACACDSKLIMRHCYGYSGGYEVLVPCRLDTMYQCVPVGSCICDFNICDHHKSSKDNNCSSDFKIPISSKLPESSDCFASVEKYRTNVIYTKLAKKNIEKHEFIIDKRTGKPIK